MKKKKKVISYFPRQCQILYYSDVIAFFSVYSVDCLYNVSHSSGVHVYNWLNSLDQSPSETDTCTAGQEILHFLWNHNVHYHVHKSVPLVPVLSQIWIQSIPLYIETHFNIIRTSVLRSPSKISYWINTVKVWSTSASHVKDSRL